MQKQAPTATRIATMAFFALSCFGLLTFLWLAFGGAIPLKPTGYQIRVAFDEATQLASQSDVTVAGVPVGKVQKVEPAPGALIATLSIDRKYAPLRRDTRATLRDKTLLGQTYVELTLGSKAATTIPERGLLDTRNVKATTQLDELLSALDPYTRQAYRTWQQGVAEAVVDRGDELNSTIGNLPEFVDSGGDLFAVLDEQKQALSALVRNSGVVFGALSEREDQLEALIENSDTVFTAIQRERESFAQIWNVLPTFLDEARATYRRLEEFAVDTRPLVRDLEPAMRDLGPTLIALRDLSPDLKRLFVNLGPLIDATRESLPAQAEIFQGLRPFLGALGPWLSEVNPTIAWINEHQHTLVDLFANLGVATQAKTGSRDPQATGHYLRQFSPQGAETLAIHPNRLSTNRGNTYINPLSLVGRTRSAKGILDAWDCRNVRPDGGEKPSNEDSPSCYIQRPYLFQGRLQKFPHVAREDYSQPQISAPDG